MIDRSLPVLAVLAAPFLLAACASQVTLPALPDCHPANPDAPSAPLATPSGVLDRAAPIPAADPMLHEGHEGHGAADEVSSEATGAQHDHAPAQPTAGTAHQHHQAPAAEPQPESGHAMPHAMQGAHGEEPGAEAATVYTCPMHPEVRSESPGTCPKCGMGLEPVVSDEGAPEEAATVYACPMHPEVRSASPATCPRCGMALEPVAPADEEPAEGAPKEGAEEAHEHDHGDHR